MLRNISKSPVHQLRLKHTSAAVEKIRERLENGPDFQDFIQNPKHSREDLAKDFEGKLKKEKGDKDRLRLPPWLKTTIPIGECSYKAWLRDLTFKRCRKKFRQNQESAARAQAVDRVRRSTMSQHRRMLGRGRTWNPDSHNYGSYKTRRSRSRVDNDFVF